jgi:hypothetical protein
MRSLVVGILLLSVFVAICSAVVVRQAHARGRTWSVTLGRKGIALYTASTLIVAACSAAVAGALLGPWGAAVPVLWFGTAFGFALTRGGALRRSLKELSTAAADNRLQALAQVRQALEVERSKAMKMVSRRNDYVNDVLNTARAILPQVPRSEVASIIDSVDENWMDARQRYRRAIFLSSLSLLSGDLVKTRSVLVSVTRPAPDRMYEALMAVNEAHVLVAEGTAAEAVRLLDASLAALGDSPRFGEGTQEFVVLTARARALAASGARDQAIHAAERALALGHSGLKQEAMALLEAIRSGTTVPLTVVPIV